MRGTPIGEFLFYGIHERKLAVLALNVMSVQVSSDQPATHYVSARTNLSHRRGQTTHHDERYPYQTPTRAMDDKKAGGRGLVSVKPSGMARGQHPIRPA